MSGGYRNFYLDSFFRYVYLSGTVVTTKHGWVPDLGVRAFMIEFERLTAIELFILTGF